MPTINISTYKTSYLHRTIDSGDVETEFLAIGEDARKERNSINPKDLDIQYSMVN